MSVSAYLLDTGPLVALLNRRDRYHHWAVRTIDALEAPLLTCEPVVSEAWFLIRRGGGDPLRLLELLHVLDVSIMPAWGPRLEANCVAMPSESAWRMRRYWPLLKRKKVGLW